ncbi:SOS response-associated peptidase family protein [Terriglobus sp.]|uniref:SOS response-associated peptidase family protein n=1 Tax=Terriglobus sp. TaxID=1889013 RepID=UPI003B00DAE0
MWRSAFARHRCLVPADSFYEWHKIRAKNNPKYEIGMADGLPFALFMEKIHTRMPVILRPKDYEGWLSREAAEQPPLDLLRPFEAGAMRAAPTDITPEEIFMEPNSK